MVRGSFGEVVDVSEGALSELVSVEAARSSVTIIFARIDLPLARSSMGCSRNRRGITRRAGGGADAAEVRMRSLQRAWSFEPAASVVSTLQVVDLSINTFGATRWHSYRRDAEASSVTCPPSWLQAHERRPASARPQASARMRSSAATTDQHYLGRSIAWRGQPQRLLRNGQRLVTQLFRYRCEPSRSDLRSGSSLAARRDDCTPSLRRRCKPSVNPPRQHGCFRFRTVTDSAPVHERHLAWTQGGGWFGRQARLFIPTLAPHR